MERHSFGKSLFLLLAVVLQLHRLVQASSSAINCSLGMDRQTPVTANQVVKSRLGEDLIVNCKGDPGTHSHLTFDCEGPHKALKKNRTTLEYTWYCRIENDGSVTVSGFEVQPPNNAFQLIAFTVKAHDLDALSEDPTTPSVNGGELVDENQQNPSSTGKESTDTESEPATSNTVGQDTRLYIVVAVLVLLFILIVAALLLVLVVMSKSRCKESKASKMEGGQNEHELGLDVEDEAPSPEEGAGQEEMDDKDTKLNTSSVPITD